MGLIGIIIASLVNIFLKSSMMYFVISILGVLIFVGLTAYDTQKIKNMYVSSDSGEVIGKKYCLIQSFDAGQANLRRLNVLQQMGFEPEYPWQTS